MSETITGDLKQTVGDETDKLPVQVIKSYVQESSHKLALLQESIAA